MVKQQSVEVILSSKLPDEMKEWAGLFNKQSGQPKGKGRGKSFKFGIADFPIRQLVHFIQAGVTGELFESIEIQFK